ncbi:uncharacterized protein LOC121414729 [Lytechinus variegatus]|uniref:uncharacterized protein LOC121414729 n=1 Tax=Lytechinus variegatus TaxID=7654 RepID=UPI001BB158DA|nr:uncharacterized protein LOC121414729 [Lytechinus variegatus]
MFHQNQCHVTQCKQGYTPYLVFTIFQASIRERVSTRDKDIPPIFKSSSTVYQGYLMLLDFCLKYDQHKNGFGTNVPNVPRIHDGEGLQGCALDTSHYLHSMSGVWCKPYFKWAFSDQFFTSMVFGVMCSAMWNITPMTRICSSLNI